MKVGIKNVKLILKVLRKSTVKKIPFRLWGGSFGSFPKDLSHFLDKIDY